MALQTAFDMVFLLPDYEHELHDIFWVLRCKNMSGVTILQQHREYPRRGQLSVDTVMTRPVFLVVKLNI